MTPNLQSWTVKHWTTDSYPPHNLHQVGEKLGITREACDAYALRSQHNWQKCKDEVRKDDSAANPKMQNQSFRLSFPAGALALTMD